MGLPNKYRRGIIKSIKNPFKSLLYAQIISVFPNRNAIEVDFLDSSGKRIINLTSPFSSMNSSRRSMPEKGSYVLLGFRSTTILNPIIIGYLSNDEYKKILLGGQVEDDVTESQFSGPVSDSEEIGIVPYRVLRSGEHEDLSSGQASAFYSSRGHVEIRGGNLLYTIDPDDLEMSFASPEFHFEGLDSDPNILQDCIRFGIVSRYLDDERWKKHLKHGDFFAKEYYKELHWDGDPNSLVLEQMGICMDENGDLITEEKTEENLRYKMELGTIDDKLYGNYVDETGNQHIKIPETASRGIIYTLTGESSSWEINIGADELKDIGQNQEVKVGEDRKVTVGGEDTLTVGGKRTVTINGQLYEKATGGIDISTNGVLKLKGSVIILN